MLFLAGLGALFMLGSAVLMGYFGLLWLKSGEWPAYTAIDGFCWLTSCDAYSWAYWPQDWLGIHRFLQWLSPAGALFWVGLAVVILSASLDSGSQPAK